MKTQVLFIVALMLHCAVNSQVTFEKIVTKGSSESAISVIPTSDRGYAFLATIGPFVPYNRWLVKTNYLGDTLWTRTFQGNGNYIIGDRNLVQTNDDGFTFISKRNEKVNLLHTSSTGDSLWEKELFTGTGYALSKTNDNGYIVTGSGSTNRVVMVSTAGPGGDLLWSKTFTLIPSNIMATPTSWAVREIQGGGFVVAGTIESGYFTHTPFLLRIGPAGDSLWYKEYNWFWDASFYSIDNNGNNGFFACGIEINQQNNCMIIKLDATGDTLWSHVLPAPGNRFFNSIKASGDGGAIACGTSSRSSNVDSSQVYLVKYSAAGGLLWERKIGNYKDAYGLSIESEGDSSFIICGEVQQTVSSNPHGLLIKTDGNGNFAGIGDHQSQSSIRVYPNPVQDRINIETSGGDCVFSLYDPLGRLVLDKTIRAPGEAIDVSALAPGIYFYTVLKNGKFRDSGKIVKSAD